MGLTFIAGIGGLVLRSFSGLIGWTAETLMRYMTSVVDKLAQQPLSSTEIEFNITTTIVSYLLITILIIYMARRTEHKFRDYNVIE